MGVFFYGQNAVQVAIYTDSVTAWTKRRSSCDIYRQRDSVDKTPFKLRYIPTA